MQQGKSDRDPSYRDVDSASPAELLSIMDATDAWPAVSEARTWILDRAAVQSGSLVADVGCAAGTFGATARKRGATSIDVDRSPAMVGFARDRNGAAPLARADVAHLPFADRSFQLVHCERVLQWVDQPRPAIAELWRVTADGGCLAITDTDWATLAVDASDLGVARRLASSVRRWIPHPELARTLPRKISELGAHDVEVRADAVALTSWDPDAPDQSDGPPGLPIATIARAATGTEATELLAAVEELARLARRGRFFATLTLVTAVGWRAPRLNGGG